ncbi:hypothetical protein [Nocardia seriolae]|uniref:Uncharacterized protein n=1 Tax=Nocardia seriolae TaxID=37332 RepID=A0A0B8NMS1_9NOCA|nr:hypothetical protein [Nocardia seriolae]APA96148.1 hypothetical protein NS506_02081 [Nocardia seriolae]MTJ65775.1 hypothetical protein [Nocardia seriolae]MTJ75118.1 hypothetical protein [Nocardia seriolae]MTJ86292.1 hypothetical protein [Nocardia seriolae]MTK30288.1 hypothetical protein [Nocardia seriolae]
MKTALAHRLPLVLAACAAAAALATGTAAADSPAPVSEYGSSADMTSPLLGLSMSPGSSALNSGSSALTSGSGLSRMASQFFCQAQGGTWYPDTAYCKPRGFQPN